MACSVASDRRADAGELPVRRATSERVSFACCRLNEVSTSRPFCKDVTKSLSRRKGSVEFLRIAQFWLGPRRLGAHTEGSQKQSLSGDVPPCKHPSRAAACSRCPHWPPRPASCPPG